MSQSVGQGRWLICFIGISKVLLAVVLLMISLATCSATFMTRSLRTLLTAEG